MKDCKQQVRTKGVSTRTIMRHPYFARGLDEVRSGMPFDYEVQAKAALTYPPSPTGGKAINAAWAYERGRCFGHIAPLSMPLFVGGRINPQALALCDAAFSRKLIT